MQKQKGGKHNIFFNFRNSLLLWIIIGIFLLANSSFANTASATEISAQALIELTNKERSKYGLNELKINSLLSQAAEKKATDIINGQNFSHNFADKKFSDWIKEAGYQYSLVGENLAVNFNDSNSLFNAWLASPTHKRNILHEGYKEIGIAVISGSWFGEETTIAVELFGAPVLKREQLVLGNLEAPGRQTEQTHPYFLASDLPEYYFNGINRPENLMGRTALSGIEVASLKNKSGSLFAPDNKNLIKYFTIVLKIIIAYMLSMLSFVFLYFYIIYFIQFTNKLKALHKI